MTPKPAVLWNRSTTDSGVDFLFVAVKFRTATIHGSSSSAVYSELYIALVFCTQKHYLILKLMPWEVFLLNIKTNGVTSTLELVTGAHFVVSEEKKEFISSHPKTVSEVSWIVIHVCLLVRGDGDRAYDVQM